MVTPNSGEAPISGWRHLILDAGSAKKTPVKSAALRLQALDLLLVAEDGGLVASKKFVPCAVERRTIEVGEISNTDAAL